MNILLCAKFFPRHFKAGENTDFARKILNGTKKHTVRSNYEYWKLSLERAKEIPGRIVSLRQWEDKPYHSRQHVILEIPASRCNVQRLEIERIKDVRQCDVNGSIFYDGYYYIGHVEGTSGYKSVDLNLVAVNDGLQSDEFVAFFTPVFERTKLDRLSFAVIQFGDLIY